MLKWTNGEIDFLKENYAEGEKANLLANLPRRSWNTIQREAQRFGIRRKFRYLRAKKSVIPLLSDFQIGYIAGFIDGEGSLMIIRNNNRSEVNYTPIITVTNTNRKSIETISNWLKIGYITDHSDNPNWAPCYSLRIQRIVDVWTLVDFIEPYLIVKRRQAQLVKELAIIKMNRSNGKDYILRNSQGQVTGTLRRSLPREEEIYKEVKFLNKRGRVK